MRWRRVGGRLYTGRLNALPKVRWVSVGGKQRMSLLK